MSQNAGMDGLDTRQDRMIGATVRVTQDGNEFLGRIVDVQGVGFAREYLITPYRNSGFHGYVWHPVSDFDVRP